MNLDAVEFQPLGPIPIRRNRVLRAQVGPRSVDNAQRLRKNWVIHPGSSSWPKCVHCATQGSHQSRVHLKRTEFNGRILVDSHWISCDDGMVKERLPAPGTPAACRRERTRRKNDRDETSMCVDNH